MNTKVRLLIYVLAIGFSLAQFNCSQQDAHSEEKDKSATTDADSLAAKDKDDKDKKKEQIDLIPVEVTTLNAGEISSFILLSSNLETERMADVYSRVQGVMEKIKVEEGQEVRKGEILATLEADEYKLAAAKALVDFQKQKSVFERAQQMHAKKLFSNEEFEQAKFTKESAEIAYKQAKLNLDYTQIEAPISGVVGERLSRVGDRVQPSDKLFSVVNTEEIIAVIHVPEKEIGRIRTGQDAFVMSDHLGVNQFLGKVKRVSPVVDPQSGTFKVTIGIRNRANKLRPGMFINVHVITETHKDAVLVPKSAIVYENETMNVYVVRDSLAHKLVLNSGFQNYEFIEALDGLQAGDKIIVVGQSGLKDQTKVKVVSERS
ncbi:MAG: efflux RND transporter periplasmic adaptor subunit [Calditrichaeota bacterium]|nr:MAG: efflux RND transporter periplasmic adaptor subunit [Calditrichota bacterium]